MKQGVYSMDDVIKCASPFYETKEPIKESVDHPKHYNAGKYEVIDVLEDWKLGFHLGNVIKYPLLVPDVGIFIFGIFKIFDS